MLAKSPRPITRSLLCAASMIALAAQALPVVAQSVQPEQVTIEAQPLREALIEVGRRYGVSLSAPDSLTRGKQAPRVSGSLSAQQAIARLLAGSGLTFRRARGGYVVLRAQASNQQSDQSSNSQRSQANEAGRQADAGKQGAPIIVTGTKQNLTLQETITSVSVTTDEQIEQQALFNVEDILLRTPNVSTFGQGSPSSLSLRGISFSGVGNAGLGQTSQIYIDSAPGSGVSLGVTNNLWDVAQVEILRGPQSTIQGRNALAGAVIITTADPEYEFGVDARAIIGNQDLRQVSGVVTGPIIEDQVAFRLAADYREADFGVIDVVRNRSSRLEETLTLRGKLLVDPEALSGLRVELTANYIDTNNGGLNGVVPPDPSDPAAVDFSIFGDQTFGDFNRLIDTETVSLIADTAYEISDNWTLIGIGTYEDSQNVIDLGVESQGSQDATVYSGEVRAAFDYDKLSGWVGAYYFDLAESLISDFTFPPSNFGFPVDPVESTVTNQRVRTNSAENFAFFFDLAYDLSERLTLNIGARYDNETVVFNQSSSGFSTPETCTVSPLVPGLGGLPCSFLAPTNTEPTQEAQFDAFLPRASIKFDIDELRSIAFTVARGYRAGGAFTFSPSANPGTVEIRTFDPEFLTNYEFAVRSEWPSLADLIFNLNVFYTNWTDQQVRILGSVGGLDDETLNAGSSELYGLEANAQITPVAGLDLFAALGLLKTEFRDFPFAATGPFQNLAGNSFTVAPELTASAGFSYEDLSGFFVSGTGAYTSSQFSDVENLEADETEDFLIVNARIGYRTGPFRISLFADNLFDERVATRVNTARVDPGTGTIQTFVGTAQTFNVNDPRVFGAELRMQF